MGTARRYGKDGKLEVHKRETGDEEAVTQKVTAPAGRTMRYKDGKLQPVDPDVEAAETKEPAEPTDEGDDAGEEPTDDAGAKVDVPLDDEDDDRPLEEHSRHELYQLAKEVDPEVEWNGSSKEDLIAIVRGE